ncbi:glycosyl hydrolase [Streptomyces sp. TRM43335]|uniref:Glycosyl hydrolase n=1 Tax=Streptomyces taklimakanensis TaxID=2569853 RepID=A0A6G2B6B1_9ACTN|nr:RICIN domain-containing protein [Streptomyces taklimakanensis]MTE17797.1 glycosyl hydrolase [Streptomyces taklimakanensis]
MPPTIPPDTAGPSRRSSVRRSVAAAFGALLLAGTGLAATTADTARAADPVARVWVTTPDGGSRLADHGTVPFTARPEAVDIRVDADGTAQRFTGAGASVTEASAHLIRRLPRGERDALMESLFSEENGIGLNYLRQPLGSTDFDADADHSTYEDTRGDFGIDRDMPEIMPVLRQAVSVNPDIRFMGSPWSPPAWMKEPASLDGGSLKAEHRQDYADYLVKAIRAYEAQGITLTDLTVQNEPLFATDYPSMSMTAAEQAAFLRVLDRTLTAAGLPTNVLAHDHNWDRPDYPLEVLDATRDIDRVIGAAFHCYGGSPEAQSRIRQAGERVFFTECSGTDSDPVGRTFADTLRWHAENLVVRNMRNGGETVVTWNLALDENGGPHQGHCGTRCNGVVEIAGDRVTRGAEYYVLGHLTKFVEPGAVRVDSTGQGPGGVQNVVFRNPDGSRAAYVVNTASSARTFSITDAGRSLSHSLPAGAVATFTWADPATGTGIDTSTWYRVVNTGSGKCLDTTDGGTSDGTVLQQWACHAGNDNQLWRFRPTDGGHHRVVGRGGTALVWDVDGGTGATADGARVHLWTWGGGANQQWRPVDRGDGTHAFVARHSGKCLDVTDASTADGAGLQQWACHGGPAQTFRLVPVSAP